MSHLLPKKMFKIEKMYKGRNPSPPGGYVDFDYRSSFNAHQLEKAIARIKAVKKEVPFSDLNFIREALENSLKVTTALRGRNQESDRSPEVVSESICYNHESTLANRGSEENSKHKEVLNDLKSLRMSDNFKTLPFLKLNSEKIYDDNEEEDDLEATFLRNKVPEIKENIFDGSSLDHSSTRCLENSSDDQTSRTKIQERRDSTEYRKRQKKSHREKKKKFESSKKRTYEDDLEEFVNFCSRRRGLSKYQTKSKYSDRSSDSDSSYGRRSCSRGRRSISKDRIFKKKTVYLSDSSPDYKSRSYKRDERRRSKESVSRSRSRDRVSSRKLRESSYSSDSSPGYKKRLYKRDERRRSKGSVSRSRSKERSRSRDRVSRRKIRESSSSSDSSPGYKKRLYKRDERRRSKGSVSRSRSKERSKSRDRVSRKQLRERSSSSDSSPEYKKRSYKRKEQSESKESNHSVGVKAEPLDDTHSESNSSFKAIPKPHQEEISKLSTEDFGNESQSASDFTREERLDSPRSQSMSNQLKLSPRSEQNDNSSPYDDEYVTRSFVGADTYYCRVCQKTLNGITCYDSHMKGKSHKKAEAALRLSETMSSHQVKNRTRSRRLVKPELSASEPDGGMFKSYETALYQEKIDAHSDDPIQGLEYVDEIHYQDSGIIAYYCNLCSARCVQTSLFGHLIGAKHCLKFLQKVNPSLYERVRITPKPEFNKKLRGVLETYEKKHGRKQITVKVCLKSPISTPLDAVNKLYSKDEENPFNSADYLDESGSYYCSLCDAPMNNENMLYSHLVGKRHLKNVNKTSSATVPSMPSTSSKKARDPNAPSKLETMLENYYESPIVGLNFIKETQNINGEIYNCYICKASSSLDIVDHITSMKHQIKYLETVDANNTIPNGIKHIRELEVNDQTRSELVADVCREIEAKHGRGRVEVYR